MRSMTDFCPLSPKIKSALVCIGKCQCPRLGGYTCVYVRLCVCACVCVYTAGVTQ